MALRLNDSSFATVARRSQHLSLNSLRVVDIVGDPGIGKSRLLYEFAQRHGADQTLILRGNCSADGQDTPFLPFIEVLRNWFSVNSGEPEETIVRKLDDGLKRLSCWSQRNTGLLLNLLGLTAPEGSLAELDGTLVCARTGDLLLRLIGSQSRQSTVVLLLEDLHWIDSASEELLLRIVDCEPTLPVVILHTRRPEYDPVWAAHHGVVELRLAPLSSSDALRMMQLRFGVDKMPEPLARLIVEKAEGNPLFVEEIASYLIERRVVDRTPEGLSYDQSLVASALPTSVQLLLTARADRLVRQDKKLLQMASVIGRRFDPDLLEAGETGVGDIGRRLEALEGLNFIQRDPETDGFEFKHVLMRDALYDSLLSSVRAELHLKVGNAIEGRSLARLSEVVEMLAHHYSFSTRRDKAFRYCSLSGRKCLDIYSLEESERYFRKALNLLRSDPNCADDHAIATAVANLLEVLYLRGDLIALREIADRYLPRLQSLGDTSQLVFALYFHCMLLNHCCEFRAAEERAKLAVDIAGRLNDIRAQAYARSALLFCSTILGRYTLEAAEVEGRRVLEICAQAADNYVLNWAYWSIAWDYVCRGLTKKGRVWAVRLIDAGRQRQDNRAVGMAYWTLAWIDIQDYKFGDAIANAERCQRIAVTPFDRHAGTMAGATGLLLEGRIEEGLAQLLSLKKWALSHSWAYAASGIDFAVGPALAMAGRIGEGIRVLKARISASDASGSVAIASWIRLSLVQLYLGMLAARKPPSIKFVLSNLPAIVKVRFVGHRETGQLLEQLALSSQIHELSTTRAWIEIAFAKLCLKEKRLDVAGQHLKRANTAALAQDSAALFDEIERLNGLLS